MGTKLFTIWFMVTFCSILANLQLFSHAEPLVPCYFIFGDSLVDNGNNNDLITLAKTNYPPYGIDYPSGIPTGRFTNGRTFVDFIAEYLGFEEDIPPNAYTGGTAILKGLNYASGAGGIRSETGRDIGDRIGFDQQLQNHGRTVSSISTILGENATSYLKQCLYTVQMGSNDYLNNYLIPVIFESNRQYTPTEYATVLIKQYSQQLMTLYDYGARKIAIIGLGPIGCIPLELATSSSLTCSEKANKDAQLFDAMLPTLVDSLNHDFSDAKFTFVNFSNLAAATLGHDSGFTYTNKPCCIVTSVTGLCNPHSTPCSDRSKYVFWDAFHPSERFTQLEAERAYQAISPLDDYPYDISTLIHFR